MFDLFGLILNYTVFFERMHYLLVIIFIIVILLSDRSPNNMLAWIFTIYVFPVGGIILYFLFGINWRKNRIVSNKMKGEEKKIFSRLFNFLQRDTSEIFRSKDFFYYNKVVGTKNENFEKMTLQEREKKINKQIDVMLQNINMNEREQEIVKMLYKSEGTFLTNNTSYRLFYNGKDAFDSILEDIKGAKHSIYMEYFIWKSDELGEKIKNLLLKKAKEGVKIKLLFDGVGAFNLSRKYKKELKMAGIEARFFLDVKFSITKLNYRNHRKMTIVDNEILHTGGMNVGQEYIDGGKRFSSWRDTNARFIGEITAQYLAIFVTDWLNSGGKNDDFSRIIKSEAVKEIKEQEPIDKQKLKYVMQVS